MWWFGQPCETSGQRPSGCRGCWVPGGGFGESEPTELISKANPSSMSPTSALRRQGSTLTSMPTSKCVTFDETVVKSKGYVDDSTESPSRRKATSDDRVHVGHDGRCVRLPSGERNRARTLRSPSNISTSSTDSVSSASRTNNPADRLVATIQVADDVFATVAVKVGLIGTTLGVDSPYGAALIEEEFAQKRWTVIQGEETLDNVVMTEVRDTLASLGVACSCIKGRKPNYPNQDNFAFARIGTMSIFAVADGHGPDGHWVSHYVMLYVFALLLEDIDYYKELRATTEEDQEKLFDLVHEAVQIRGRMNGFDTAKSGSTLTICLLDADTKFIHTAWVGDSRAVNAWQFGRQVEALTRDHKPNDTKEKMRIQNTGADVVLTSYGGSRVCAPGSDRGGLAMSRAICDTASEALGVVHQPGVGGAELLREGTDEQFILLCSDGIWEFISNAEAGAVVGRYGRGKCLEAVQELTEQAKRLWLQNQSNESTDDITIILIWI